MTAKRFRRLLMLAAVSPILAGIVVYRLDRLVLGCRFPGSARCVGSS